MSIICQPPVQNRLLERLPESEIRRLTGQMEAVNLPLRHVLSGEGRPAEHAYFLASGIASIVINAVSGKTIEAGMIGREGVTPPLPLEGSDQSPMEIFMQVAGSGLRIELLALRKFASQSEVLAETMHRFAQVLMIQISFTALSHALNTVDQRLARWLLMCHDRIDGDEIPITHEFLATMLAVRRPSVTDALHVLEGDHLIRNERGYVLIRNRTGLETLAGDSYGRAEAEYRRLIGD